MSSPTLCHIRPRQLLGGFFLSVAALVGHGEAVHAQDAVTVAGTVIDLENGEGVADVVVRIGGTGLTTVTNEAGRFVIRDVPPGHFIFSFGHLAYGSHDRAVEVGDGNLRLDVRISRQAIQLDEILVEGQSNEQRERRARGSSQRVVDRVEIERALGTSKHLGDLVRQTVPGMHLRQSNDVVGRDVCLEFRAAATISLVGQGCRSPQVFLDGVPVSDPNLLYGMLSLHTIEEIEVIPPGEAGARYGTGSLYGVLLITTQRPGRVGDPSVPGSRPIVTSPKSFDWTLDPEGHSTKKAFFGAFLGNALGLAAGVLIARQCIDVDTRDEITTTCGNGGTAAVGVSAVLLPAFGGSLGARWAGGTDRSVGRLIPATLGAALALFPGYAFAMSTEGSESQVVNVVGQTLLVVGVPALVTVADRLFRNTR